MLKQEDITKLQNHFKSGKVDTLINESIELLKNNSKSVILLDILGSLMHLLKIIVKQLSIINMLEINEKQFIFIII